jgi:hypothetical protein
MGAVGSASWIALAAAAEPIVSEPVVYRGMCDASAGVALSAESFAVGNDEDNILRTYHTGQGGGPVGSSDFSAFLRVDPKSPETDLEGAAWLGERVFWITSHGRNRDGKYRESRHRFFATEVLKTFDGVRLLPVGRPYTRLLADLLMDPRLRPFHLAAASKLPPKHRAALNIEGLCATPGGQLLIGFRNPIPFGRALVIPLLNPKDVINGSLARIGDPILLNLAGQGIRDIGFWRGKYLIVAGSPDAEGVSKIYQWGGVGTEPARLPGVDLRDFNPEALVIYPDNPRSFQLLSDDGTLVIGGVDCKHLADPMQRRFRSVWITPQ